MARLCTIPCQMTMCAECSAPDWSTFMSKHKQSHEECRCADGGCACGGGHGHNHEHGDAGELKATLVRVIASAALLILFSALPTTGALRVVLLLIPYLLAGYDILWEA